MANFSSLASMQKYINLLKKENTSQDKQHKQKTISSKAQYLKGEESVSTKSTVQGTFMNKISNFEGDNDHVDEEFESSGEKDKQHSNDDENLQIQRDEEEMNIRESQEFKLGQTYGQYDMVTSERGENRILSDLSSKVVNFNGEGAINGNPFNQN